MEIISNNIDDLYKRAFSKILSEGIQVKARGLDFKEIRFQHLILTNPRARIIQNPERKFNKRFAMGEFIWTMSGKCSLNQIEFYNKRMRDFSDDGVSLHGAYGPRLRHWSLQHGDVDQLENCLQRLRDDIYTRQASIVILDPAIDFIVKTKDIPCNNYLQFLYREGKLDLLVYIRSNDLFLGFPYDVHSWCMLQEIFASILNIELGQYHHMVGSLHAYNQDINKLTKILSTPIVHIPMEPMPKVDDLSIINQLSDIEEKYRLTGILDTSNINSYWQNYLNFLKK